MMGMTWGELAWLGLGFGAQGLFFCRIVLQWIVSERRGESVIPEGFWWLSLGGAVLLLVYSIHRRDPVFIVGQCLGSFIYIRNLVLVHRKKRAAAAPAE
jgi:lipid-A-disaccharide synthase-like uncharacterized protein